MPGWKTCCAIPRRSEPCGAASSVSRGRPRRRWPVTGRLSSSLPPFANEPPTDFTRPENRERFRAALGRGRRPARPVVPAGPGGRGGCGGRDVCVPRSRRLGAGDRPVSPGRPPTTPGGPSPSLGRRWRSGRAPRRRRVRRCWSGPPRFSAAASSHWRPGRSSSAPSRGARPTATSPRRSTSASSTPGR